MPQTVNHTASPEVLELDLERGDPRAAAKRARDEQLRAAGIRPATGRPVRRVGPVTPRARPVAFLLRTLRRFLPAR